jgi:hypothetical protein
MKLRIKGNAIRLRLTKSELKTLKVAKKISEKTNFGINNCFHYVLSTSEMSTELEVIYDQQGIHVIIPSILANDWIMTDEVSIHLEKVVDQENTLQVLIEKDFQCLKVREGEDESDQFPNPNIEKLEETTKLI